MKAITVCEPYASAIIFGPKRVENRQNPWRFRGRLLIHAGKSRKFMKSMTPQQHQDWSRNWRGLAQNKFQPGMIIGCIEIYGCIAFGGPAMTDDLWRDPWACGPYCLLLRAPEPLPKPIPYRGALGLFDVPDELLK